MPPRQHVSLSAAVAIVVGTMIGTGVYGSLGFQVAAAPSAFPILLLWMLGGLLALCGAVNYAELTAALPRSGGEYHLLGRVYHPALGFMSGWISMTVGFPAPMAVSAVFFANYASSATGWIWRGNAEATVALLSVAVLGGMTLLHFISVRASGRAQTFLTVLKVVMVAGLAGSGFLAANPENLSFWPKTGDGALMLRPDYAISLIFVLYAYSGWNAACYIAGELKDPGRTAPRALIIGTLVVTVLYVALNAAFLHSTPMAELSGEADIGFVAARRILGENGARLVAGLIAAGLMSSISGLLWAGSRVAQTMGRDHGLLAPLSLTTRRGVPWVAVLLQSGLALVFLMSTSVSRILACTEFSLQLVLVLTVWGVVHLRRREPALPRPYRAWGYPWTTGLFLGLMAFILAYLLENRHRESLWGLGNALLALAVYAGASKLTDRCKKSNP
ncbi:MAG: amino acid permease-associated region [Verrucomicrobiales bacterium]|nr:amino acid permease-associated region [Verrucomicrobiales bacterium]